MALHRENGKEQPFIPAGPFKIRIPFIHYRWEISECLQAILMCATCLGAIPVLQELLGVPYEVAWSMVIINGFFYNLHSLLGDPASRRFFMFFITCSACASIPSGITPVSGSTGICPDANTKPFASIA